MQIKSKEINNLFENLYLFVANPEFNGYLILR